MKKHYFVVLVIVFFVISLNVEAQNRIELVSSTINETVLTLYNSDFTQKPVITYKGNAVIIQADQATPILKQGAPDLPKYTTSIIIPDQAEMQAEVIHSQYTDYLNIDVAPSKGNFTRDISPNSVPYFYGEVYNKNTFYPGKLTDLRSPHILRDYRGQTVVLYPFQYNPVTRVLRVYTQMTVKISVKSLIGGENPLINKPNHRLDQSFELTYQRHFLNYNLLNTGKTTYTPVNDYGKMLIICHDAFVSAAQPLVQWKKQKGIPTELVLSSTVGTTPTAIKTYIQNYYNLNGLTFVLLVGDHTQIPAYNMPIGASDNAYTYVVGTDHYPDLFIGRLSANTISEVQVQVNKIITYEKTPMTGANWYKNAVGIASDEGPGDDGEYDYQHLRNIRTKLLGFTYTNVAELYDGSQGGADAAGNPTASDLATIVNAGVSLINYTGHGSSTSFATTGYSNTDVNASTNGNKLPIIFSVACVNGDFTSGTCFAEAWLRKANGGAVATLMSTVNQSWNPPMEGQDEMNDILSQQYLTNKKFTFAGVAMNGCMKMNDSYGTAGEDMTDTWTVFGDPSLMYYTDSPSPLTATHISTTPVGTNNLVVNCPVNGALVGLIYQGDLIASGFISGGTVNLTFSPVNIPDTIFVTVTAFNKTPYFGFVKVQPASGPYVIRLASSINDAVTGNNNGNADFAENIQLNMTLKNVGIATANNVNTILSTTSPYATVTVPNQNFGDVLPGATATQNGVYGITIANNVPDQTAINFNLNITDDASNVWNSPFVIIANAPKFNAHHLITINDITGNNNHRLDAGENNVQLIIPSYNIGHATSTLATGTLTTTSPYLTVVAGTSTLGIMNTTGTYNANFVVNVSAATPRNTLATLHYTITAGAYTFTKTYTVRMNVEIEDFETNTLTSYPWSTSGAANWFVTNQDPYQGDYCVESGDIDDNENSILEIFANVQTPDSLSFYYKVSSEQYFDFLQFYMDGVKKNEWSGVIPWQRKSYYVSTSGIHNFKWVYMKDYIISAHEDCAWVDEITFPPLSVSNSIESPAYSTDIKLYPNPMKDLSFIDYTLNQNTKVSIYIIDMQGKRLLTLKENEEQVKGRYTVGLHKSMLPSGMYVVEVVANGSVNIHKLVISE
ncbi:MAG: C25 family cysteine peptidase [Bacteroidia bacterium]|nr:C25 family cysteine peptidase [Bacteroidia bacterium]MDW8347088.1 C25 family cysteine peptidase [Bacteroidia bacterium]